MTTAPIARRRQLGGELGCVLAREVGVLLVLTDTGPLRASYGVRLLGRLAADPGCLPEPGEWVALRRWPDGPVTAEMAPGAEPTRPTTPPQDQPQARGLATVVPLRRRH